MPQNSAKPLQKTSASARKTHKNPKKGQRVVAPKKHKVIQSLKLKKSLSAKINNSIEHQMVSKASSGPLSIMKPAPESKAN